MIIWGRPIATELEILLEDLRLDAREKTGVSYFSKTKKSGSDIFVTCPCYDKHDGEERTPSCSIDTETGMLHCFGCGYSDSLPGLVHKVMGYKSKIEGYRWILRKYSMPVKGERPLVPLDFSSRRNVRFYLPESSLEAYNYDHPYMFKRGLTREVIDLFNLGFCTKTKSITIPMRDSLGRLVFVKKRPIQKTKFHKYHVDEGMEKRDIVFGLDIIKRNLTKVKMVFLCEGEFDVMSYYAIGKFAGGIQGDELFEEQLKQLMKVIKGIPICLSFDNDSAGRACQKKAIELLYGNFPLYKVKYPGRKYKDPNDLLLDNLLGEIDITSIWPFYQK